jgi:hypothetical protein
VPLIKSRDDHVGYDQSNLVIVPCGHAQSTLAITSRKHAVAVGCQCLRHDGAERSFLLDDENGM